MFSPVKRLTGPPVEMAGGSPVEHVIALVELDNAPAEPDKRRSFENDREQWFRGYEGGMELAAFVGMMIKWKQRW